MTYVLRAKGETQGHIFYECMEDFYVNCEKVKYATEFETVKDAEKEIEKMDKKFKRKHEFDIITLEQAEQEYYHP